MPRKLFSFGSVVLALTISSGCGVAMQIQSRTANEKLMQL